MPFPPPNPSDPFSLFSQADGQNSDSFAAPAAPSVSGLGTRQSRVPSERTAVTTRHLIHWMIPEQPIIQMYCNPQNITYNHRKAIVSQRTKGGFVIQYWGEELSVLRLTGTTGSSGYEGINILNDIYRSEQLALDPYALFLDASNDAKIADGGTIGSSIGSVIGGATGGAVGGLLGGLLTGASTGTNVGTRSKPTLAYLATSIEMYFSGEVYRGYFSSFNVTESADQLGMFNYDMEFNVTQKRGFRQNYLPWHRSATSGPSNSDPNFGTPHSFGRLIAGDSAQPQRDTETTPDILASIKDSLGGF
jgi:hypothetical protein